MKPSNIVGLVLSIASLLLAFQCTVNLTSTNSTSFNLGSNIAVEPTLDISAIGQATTDPNLAQPTVAQQAQPTVAQQAQPTVAQQVQPTVAQQVQPTVAQQQVQPTVIPPTADPNQPPTVNVAPTQVPGQPVQPTQPVVIPPTIAQVTQAPIATTIPFEIIINTSAASVNIRRGPGTQFQSIGFIPNGTRLQVISRTNTNVLSDVWFLVNHINANQVQLGWVSGLVAAPDMSSGDLQSIPIAEQATIAAPSQ